MADNLIQSALAKVRETASQILKPAIQATQDNQGFIQQGKFVPTYVQQTPFGQAVKRLAATPVAIPAPLAPVLEFGQRVGQLGAKTGEGVIESASLGLVDVPFPKSTTAAQKVAYGLGTGLGFLVSPVGKVLGTVGRGAEAAIGGGLSAGAPQLPKIVSRVAPILGAEAAQVGTYLGGQALAQQAGLRPTEAITPATFAQQVGLGLGLRGALNLPQASALIKGITPEVKVLSQDAENILSKDVTANKNVQRAINTEAKNIEQRLLTQGIEKDLAKTQAQNEARQLVASRVEALKAPAQAVTPPVTPAQVVTVPQLQETTWFRGINKLNKGQTDKFYSAAEEVAQDYADDAGKVITAKPQDLPKNPLVATDKTELAEIIEYKGDPFVQPISMKQEDQFDTQAKKYAQSRGFDSIYYLNGSLDEPELHVFGKQAVTPPVTPVQGAPEISLQQTVKDLTPTIQTEVQVPIKQAVQTAKDVIPTAKATETPVSNPALKERKFSQTVMSSPKTVEQVKQQFNRQFYAQLPNAKTIAEADKVISKDLDNAITIAKSGESSALNNAISMRLVEKFQNEGNFTQARDILETLSAKPTSQGQAIQILSYWGKLTPAGAVRTAQTIADRAAREANVPTKAISEQTVREITRIAQEAQKLPEGRAKVVKQAELVDKIYSVLPASMLQKISSIQTLAQLLNPKTAIRNVLGNFLFQVGENVSRIAALPADILASLVTGKRTLLPPSIGTQARGFGLGLKEGVEDALKAVDTAKVGTQFDISGRTFRAGVLDKLERLLNLELKAPDRAFYRAAFDESLGMQMKLAQVTEPTSAMLEIAHKDALYRTFQDSSFLARMFSGLKRALNVGKEWGLGDLLIKYPKTPANLIARGIDYSPAGFVKTIMEMANPLFGKEFNQKAFAESFGRAIVGSVGLINTGYILHKLGILTGKPEEDKDIRATQRVLGTGQYKINVSALKRYVATGLDPVAAKPQPGDMLINYDWVQPFAIGVSMGANISANQNKMAKGGYVDTLLSSLEEGVSTIEQQPLIRGLANLGRFGSVVDSLKQTAIGVPASFIPGVVNQLTQATDNIQRNTYDPNMLQEAVNMAKARLPYLSKQLQPMYSVYGQPLERYQQGTNTFFNIFFNPAFVTTLKSTPVGDEVLRIYQMTGETQQAPKIADKTINVNGQKMELTAQQLADYQQYIGSKTNQYFNQLLNDPVYLGLSDTERAKKMANVLTDVNTAAKIELFNNQPKTVSGQAQTILSGGQIEVTTPELKKLQAQLKKQAKIKTKRAKGIKAPKLKRITIKRIALKKVKLPKAKAIKLTPIKPIQFAGLKQPKTSRVTKLKTIKVRA